MKDVLDVGLLAEIPYSVAAVTILLMARSSDASGERRWHTAFAAALGCDGQIFSALNGRNTVVAMVVLSIAAAGILSTLPLFWTLPTSFLSGTAAVAGIAMLSAIGNLAVFVSPFMVGAIKDATQSTTIGMYALAASLAICGLLVIVAITKSMSS
ncbi:MAG: hypothetical protein H7Z77_05980 [Chitinophagaceae bacterium]|nr:hypothetical protein [Polaromonas sp.]